jgi:DNA end-binding protein Ku
VMRERQYLAAVRPRDGVLVLETMFFADEVRDPKKQLDRLPGKGSARGKDLDMAVGLIKSLTTKWDPKNYRDTYTARVEKLIKAKKDDREIVTESTESGSPEKVTDLLAALQASVDAAKNHKPGNASRVTKLRTQKRSAIEAVAEGADDLTKTELTAAAKELGVEGRSKMSEKKLRTAVKKAAKETTKKTSKKASSGKSTKKAS